ncbi:hypothetical protein NliqN6_0309 [Naganishia liquefaciens]|uniref:Uncharacterized protein n=1 Tax=Naganishia liquefaciens TaxID=104408 RepID=A0A8H3YD40_9TREE|nr:hypothetical protein NliqN6_0309 [Naganishia liquefaciens]
MTPTWIISYQRLPGFFDLPLVCAISQDVSTSASFNMPSLKSLLKQRLGTALTCGPPNTWKVLVVDDYSNRLLESVYKTFDVLHMNITAIDPLMSPRSPQPTLDAVYLLTPTTQNVKRVLADFQEARRTYRHVHLYFIDGVSDTLAEQLTNGLPEDVLQSFVELYCNFWPLESQVFTTNMPSTFFTLFGNPGGIVAAELAQDRFEEDVKLMSKSVLNLLATLGENPYIRYYAPHHHPPLGPLAIAATPGSVYGSARPPSANPAPQAPPEARWKSALNAVGGKGGAQEFSGDQISRRIALQLQADLDDYQAVNPDFPPSSNHRPKSILFVVDRSMDPVAPFLHEFTYQAMIHDLLPLDSGPTYRYKVKTALGAIEQKEALLNEEDPIWVEIRHMHMKEAIDKLMVDFNRFTTEHAGFKNTDNASSLDDMKDMLASLPSFTETRDKFSAHLEMSQTCMNTFSQSKLPQAANVEQCCATGVTPEGKNPKSLVEDMIPLLSDKTLSNKDKVRIIALWILHRDGVPDEDRKRLFQHARLSLGEQDAVNNLTHLGSKVVKVANDRNTRTRLKQKYGASDDDYELSRYKPIVRQIIEEQASGRLNQNDFPYLRDAPAEVALPAHSRPAAVSASSLNHGGSLRSARPTWHKAPAARVQATSESRQRIILFVAGGMTYSEQRLAYLIGDSLNKEVIIGSTHQITPETFINDMRTLGRAGVGGNPPNAKPLSPYAPPASRTENGRQPTYQMILDSRVWSEPVGPPPLPPVATPPAPQPSRFGSSRAVPRDASPAPTTGSKMSSFGLGRGKDEKKKDKEERKAMEAAAAAAAAASAGNGNGNGHMGGGDSKKKGLFKIKW